MQIAFKRSASSSMSWWQKMSCQLIKFRLCSQYCHGAIVIDGKLYQSTASHGLHVLNAGEWEPDKWDIFETTAPDTMALYSFIANEGAPYDWAGVLRFIFPFLKKQSDAFYCFEWQRYAITGQSHVGLVTPESVLAESKKW